MNASTDFETAIVRVTDINHKKTFGTGFVVSDSLIVTCAHVVLKAQADAGGTVGVVFHAAQKKTKATVVPEWWRDEKSDDIAILRLAERLPAEVSAVALGGTRGCKGHAMRTLGFPQLPRGYEVAHAAGEIHEVVPHSAKRSILQLNSPELKPGMSGAPVFDVGTERVVGMVSEGAPSDPSLTWATTTDTLASVCTELHLRASRDIENYLTAVAGFCDELPYVGLDANRPLTEVYVRLDIRDNPADEPPDEHDARIRRRKIDGPRGSPMPIEDMLAADTRLVLVAGPGAGKSTLLRHLVRGQLASAKTNDSRARFALRDSGALLPILVSSRGFASHRMDVLTALRQQVTAELGVRLPKGLPDNFLDDWMTQTGARWLIALDGLDEIVEPTLRRDFLHDLGEAAWPGGSTIVLSSRPDEVIDSERHFSVCQLVPWGSDQIRVFARQWFAPDEAVAAAFLKETSTSRLGELLNTPLVLTVAAMVFERMRARGGGEALAGLRRTAVYERFMEALLDADEDKNREIRDQFKTRFGSDGEELFDCRREVLERLALAMQEGRSPVEELIAFLRDSLQWKASSAKKKAGMVLETLAERRAGLLVRRAAEYDFTHQSFQEFLAAAAIVRECGEDPECLWSRAVSHWPDARWREVALFSLGGLSDRAGSAVATEALIERIFTHGLDEPFDWFHFVIQSLAECSRIGHQLTSRIVDAVITRARTPEYWRVSRALRELGRLRDEPCVVDGLLSLASDRHLEGGTSVNVGATLGQLGRPEEGVSLLRAVVQSSDDAHTRVWAAREMGELGHAEEAVASLVSLAQNERVPTSGSVWAAKALAELGRFEKAVTILIALAQDARADVAHRVWGARDLGKLGHVDDAIGVLRPIASNEDVKGEVRLDAARALAEIGDAEDATACNRAIARSERVEGWDRALAAQALSELGQREEGVALLRTLAQDGKVGEEGRVVAAYLLGDLGAEDAQARLRTLAEAGHEVASELQGMIDAIEDNKKDRQRRRS